MLNLWDDGVVFVVFVVFEEYIILSLPIRKRITCEGVKDCRIITSIKFLLMLFFLQTVYCISNKERIRVEVEEANVVVGCCSGLVLVEDYNKMAQRESDQLY